MNKYKTVFVYRDKTLESPNDQKRAPFIKEAETKEEAQEKALKCFRNLIKENEIEILQITTVKITTGHIKTADREDLIKILIEFLTPWFVERVDYLTTGDAETGPFSLYNVRVQNHDEKPKSGYVAFNSDGKLELEVENRVVLRIPDLSVIPCL